MNEIGSPVNIPGKPKRLALYGAGIAIGGLVIGWFLPLPRPTKPVPATQPTSQPSQPTSLPSKPTPYPLRIGINVPARELLNSPHENIRGFRIVDMGTSPPNMTDHDDAKRYFRLHNPTGDCGTGPSGRDAFARDKMNFYPVEGVALEDVPGAKFQTKMEEVAKYDQTYRRIIDIEDATTRERYGDALAKLLISRIDPATGTASVMLDNFTMYEPGWIPFDVSLKFGADLKAKCGPKVKLFVNSTACPGHHDSGQIMKMGDTFDGLLFEQWCHVRYVRPYKDRIDEAIDTLRHTLSQGKLVAFLPIVAAENLTADELYAEQELEARLAAGYAMMVRENSQQQCCVSYWVSRPIPGWASWPEILGEPVKDYHWNGPAMVREFEHGFMRVQLYPQRLVAVNLK